MNEMQKLQKLAVLGWGGRHKDYSPKSSPIQARVGYTNLMGLVPFPNVGVRFGSRDGIGATIGTAGIGISSKASKSFKDRPSLKGASDILLEGTEDVIARIKKRKKGSSPTKSEKQKMNDMQKLAFDYGYQTEMEKLAGLDKAKRAVKEYWGHLSGKTLKGAKKDLDSLAPVLKGAKKDLASARRASEIADKDRAKAGKVLWNAQKSKKNLNEAKLRDEAANQKANLARKAVINAQRKFFNARYEAVDAEKKYRSAKKSQYKTRRNTGIVGGTALTGGGVYAYDPYMQGNKK